MQSKMRLSKAGLWAVLLLACAVVLMTGGVVARYVSANRQRTEMESAQFHISSNYLEEENGAEYTVADWGNGFDILLYNYEKENIAQISGLDMTYTVSADNAAVSVKQGGTPLTADEGAYLFGAQSSGTYHVLHVTPKADAGAGDKITVTVKTISPFEKTMKATFTIQSHSMPDYTVMDQGDGTIRITIKTNDYKDSMTVEWDPSKYSPDNTNDVMQAWTDTSATGSFQVKRNSTYELLFFKNTEENYSKTDGTGTTISLS